VRGAAGRSAAAIAQEVEGWLGFVPALLAPAAAAPRVLENLWQQTLSAYLDNPLPTLLKEKLFAHLSRDQSSPYCLVCHGCALRGLGQPAAEVLRLLRSETPELDADSAAWLTAAPIEAAAAEGEAKLFAAAVLLFRQPAGIAELRPRLQQALGAATYAQLSEFLLYVRTCHATSRGWPSSSPARARAARASDERGRTRRSWGRCSTRRPTPWWWSGATGASRG